MNLSKHELATANKFINYGSFPLPLSKYVITSRLIDIRSEIQGVENSTSCSLLFHYTIFLSPSPDVQ